jgi:hypothetical protein
MNKMSSLFDDSDDDVSDIGMNSECDADDDNTTFTVATVLANSSEKSNRRDTITRIMPTITIHDRDKYAMPTTVEKARMKPHHQQEENRTQLRSAESLIDDSPTNSENEEDFQCRKRRIKESIFRAPLLDGQIDNDLRNTSMAMVRTIAPAHHIQANDRDGIDNRQSNTTQQNHHQSSATLMTYYEGIATKGNSHAVSLSKIQNNAFPTARGANVKSLVSSALKIVADGLAPLVVDSWDVDEPKNLSGNKRSKGMDQDKENNDKSMQNRRKSFNIRAEMTLLQDLLQEKTDECARLRQVSSYCSLQIADFQSHRLNCHFRSSSTGTGRNQIRECNCYTIKSHFRIEIGYSKQCRVYRKCSCRVSFLSIARIEVNTFDRTHEQGSIRQIGELA